MTRKNPLVEVLEAIFWNMPAERRADVTILITHRGARNDVKVIPVLDIACFDRGYIYIKKQEGEKGMDYEDEVPIPLHRVLEVLDVEGAVLYKKGEKKAK
jgi:uncharacterized protein (UPF0248 family)